MLDDVLFLKLYIPNIIRVVHDIVKHFIDEPHFNFCWLFKVSFFNKNLMIFEDILFIKSLNVIFVVSESFQDLLYFLRIFEELLLNGNIRVHGAERFHKKPFTFIINIFDSLIVLLKSFDTVELSLFLPELGEFLFLFVNSHQICL